MSKKCFFLKVFVTGFIIALLCISMFVVFTKAISANSDVIPVIDSVSPIVAARLQTIVIRGRGFGDTQPVTMTLGDGSINTVGGGKNMPGEEGTPVIQVNNYARNTWAAGVRDSPETGWCSIGIFLENWSDTEIVLGGFGSALSTTGQGEWSIEPGDPMRIVIITAEGMAAYDTTVVSNSAEPTPTPSSGSEVQVEVSGVTASSYDGIYTPSLAVDGIESTSNYWGTNALIPEGRVPQWLMLDLGSQVGINQVTTHFYDGDSRIYTYYIEVSNDGSSWTAVVPTKSGSQIVTDQFAQVDARFVRINIIDNTANSAAHIEEIRVYRPKPQFESILDVFIAVAVVAAGLGLLIYLIKRK